MDGNKPSTSKNTDGERLVNIFHTEIDKELSDRMSTLASINANIKLCKEHLDRLRKMATIKFYMDSVEESEPTVQQSIHPAVQKLIGKRPATAVREPTRQTLKRNERERNREAKKRRVQDMISSNYKHKSEKSNARDSSCSINEPSYLNVNSDNTARRGNTKKVLMRVLVGNVAKEVDTVFQDSATHKWMVYIRSPSGSLVVESQVAKVCFFLHPSYKPHDVVTVVKPPFTLSRRGWGEFPMRIQLYFKNSLNKPADIVHILRLTGTRSGHYTRSPETFAGIWVYPFLSQEKENIYKETSTGQILLLASNMVKETVPDFSSEMKCQKCSRTISETDNCSCMCLSVNSGSDDSDEQSDSEILSKHEVMELRYSESSDSDSSDGGPKLLGRVNTFAPLDHLDDPESSRSSSTIDFGGLSNMIDEDLYTGSPFDKCGNASVKSEESSENCDNNGQLIYSKIKTELMENNFTTSGNGGSSACNTSNITVCNKQVKSESLDIDFALDELNEVLDQNIKEDIAIKEGIYKEELNDDIINIITSSEKAKLPDEIAQIAGFKSSDLLEEVNIQHNLKLKHEENDVEMHAERSVKMNHSDNINMFKENDTRMEPFKYFDECEQSIPVEVDPLSLETDIIYDYEDNNQLFNDDCLTNSPAILRKNDEFSVIPNNNSIPSSTLNQEIPSSNLIEEETPIFDFMNTFVEEEIVVESPCENNIIEQKNLKPENDTLNHTMNSTTKTATQLANTQHCVVFNKTPTMKNNIVAYSKSIYVPKKPNLQSINTNSRSLLLKSQPISLLKPKFVNPKVAMSSTTVNTPSNRSILIFPPNKSTQTVNVSSSKSLLKPALQSNYNCENSVKSLSNNTNLQSVTCNLKRYPADANNGAVSPVILETTNPSKNFLKILEISKDNNHEQILPKNTVSSAVNLPVSLFKIPEGLTTNQLSFEEFTKAMCFPKSSVPVVQDALVDDLVCSLSPHSDLAPLSFDSFYRTKLITVSKDQVTIEINQQVFYFLQQLRKAVNTCRFAEMEYAVRHLVRAMPLVHSSARLVSFKRVHPYSAATHATYCSWPRPKQAASEWLRAKTVVRLLTALRSRGVLQQPVWTTRTVYRWAKDHGYCPALKLPGPGNSSHNNEEYVKKLHLKTPPDRVMEWVASVQSQKKTEKEVDVTEVESAVHAVAGVTEPFSRLPLVTVTGRPWVSELVSHVRVAQADPVATTVMSHLAALLAEDLLRRALTQTLNRNGDMVAVGDICKAILLRPEYDIFTKQGLDVDTAMTDILKLTAAQSSRQ